MKENERPRPLDFYVRMHEAEFERLPMRQLQAQLDWSIGEEVISPIGVGARASPIYGYTEWVTDSAPTVSVGWDWVASATGVLTLIPESVRTNLMLVTKQNKDRGQAATVTAIIRLVNQLPWQQSVLDAL